MKGQVTRSESHQQTNLVKYPDMKFLLDCMHMVIRIMMLAFSMEVDLKLYSLIKVNHESSPQAVLYHMISRGFIVKKCMHTIYQFCILT